MGINYSAEDLQWHVERLVEEVENFNGTITSIAYANLQNELIRINANVLKLKKSHKSETKQCDKMLTQLNHSLMKLTAKVTQSSPTEEDFEDATTHDTSETQPKRNAEIIIHNFEQEADKIELEVEKAIRTKDAKQSLIIEGKLKLFFADLSVNKVERGTLLDHRKNKILQRLLHCYKQMKKESPAVNSWLDNSDPLASQSHFDDTEFDSDFDSVFDDSSYTSSSRSQSTKSPTRYAAFSEEPIYENAEIILQERQKRLEAAEKLAQNLNTVTNQNLSGFNKNEEITETAFDVLKMPPKKTISKSFRGAPLPSKFELQAYVDSDSDWENDEDSIEKRNDLEGNTVVVNAPIPFESDEEEPVIDYLEDEENIETKTVSAPIPLNDDSDFDFEDDFEHNEEKVVYPPIEIENSEHTSSNSFSDDDDQEVIYCSDVESNTDECTEVLNPMITRVEAEFCQELLKSFTIKNDSSETSKENDEDFNHHKETKINKVIKIQPLDYKERKINKIANSIDYTEEINKIAEQLEDLKILYAKYRETHSSAIYSQIQEKLTKSITRMFKINTVNFDKKSLVLYDIISQNIQEFVNELQF